MLDALANPELAAAVLDLANYLYRRGQMDPHPATPRVGELSQLAEAIVALLDSYQDSTPENPNELLERQEKVANGVPLAISLCDALALIGDERTIPTLEHMLALKHRRIRVEAAAALVRFGQEGAIAVLNDLAAEPSVRSRVLAYADELDVLEAIDVEYRSPVSEAEAQLISHLSEPTNMGLPPTTCELIDSRILSWPGYEEPRNCYLFRYSYQVIDSHGQPTTYSNVGISGPLSHAFHSDLSPLSVPDMYAAFAGWQAEHEEISEQPLQQRTIQPQVVLDFIDRLANEDYENIEPLALANFFQDEILVARAEHESVSGAVVVDHARTSWFPGSDADRAIGPAEAYAIYKGRRLLRSFNDDFWDEADASV